MSKRFSGRSEKAMRALVVAAVCAALALSSFAGANLIVNGAFEDQGTYMPRISSRANGTYAYYSDGQGFNASPWTFTGTAGLCVSNSAFLGGIYGYDIGTYAMFLRQTATAQQMFNVTETGCYRLSLKYWAWQGNVGAHATTVQLIHGSDTVTLGTLSPSISNGMVYQFDFVTNITETGSYTLKFSQTKTGSDGGNTFDEIKFMRVGGVNFVKNPGFEEGSISGSNYTRIGGSGYSNPYWTGGAVPNANNWICLCGYNNMSGFFNHTYWNPGKYALAVRNTAATDTSLAQQEITFDEPGLYRVSFAYLGWVDTREHLSTEVRLAHGATTNVIGAIDHADARWGKALACTCYAEITEAGTYALQFTIPGNTAVTTANIIDNVVVNRCGSQNLIQNGSFDAGGGTGGNYIKSTASDYSNPGWTGSRNDNFGLAVPGVGFNADGQTPHALGVYALYFRNSGLSAQQSFDVPEAGYYHLSFVHWGWNKGGIPTSVNVLQVKDGGATTDVCGYAEFTPLSTGGNGATYYEVSQFNGLVFIPEAGECVISFSTLSGYNNTYATQIDNVSFVKYDADEFAAGNDAPFVVDMLPVSSDGSVAVPRAVYAGRAVVESGQVVKMGVHVHAAYNPAFMRNNGTIVMDEFKVDTQFPSYIHSLSGIYAGSSSGKLRVGKIVDAGTIGEVNNPRFRLNAVSGGAEYIVGAGGFSFLNNRRLGANCSPYYAVEGAVRVDPYADYAVGPNPFSSNNQSLFIFDNATLTLGTTDYDDPTIARTVTCNGGIGSYAKGVLNVDGIGTVVFNSTDNDYFQGALNVKDSATLLLKDGAHTGSGTLSVKSGATLKFETSQTLSSGFSVACEAGAILDFDVSRLGADVAAATFGGFTPPESGRVTVKVRGREGGGARKLLTNLPEGVTKANFALDRTGLPGHVTLMVRDGSLVLRPCGFMMIVK
ncbi:MAG: hypothetical protein IKL96_01595 [Kiritimatiellae bacterium]|nr:hypothetical protein [Kiritimatiellia bacterium]